LELILSHAKNPDNLFIIRGDEKDNKQNLLHHIGKLQAIAPIPKEEFILNKNQASEWNILDKIIQKVSEEGTELLNSHTNFMTELATIKKYKKLVVKQNHQYIQLLQQLETTTLSKEELENIRDEIFTLAEELNNQLTKNKKEKQDERTLLENELTILDTNEPIRYKHRNSEKVIFEEVTAAVVTIGVSAMLLTPLIIPTLLTYVVGIPGLIIGGISAGIAKILQKSGLDISDETVIKALIAPVIPAQLCMTPTYMLTRLLTTDTHHFKYDDIPFLHIERKSDPPISNEILNNLNDAAKSIFPEWWVKLHELYSGFDLSTEVNEPSKGKYEVVYKNNMDLHDKITVWIEVFVEKRNHPEFKSKIEMIQRKLKWIEYTLSGYLKYEIEQLAKKLAQEKALLTNISTQESLQATLCEILKSRLSGYQKRKEILHGCFLGYQASIKECHKEILRQSIRHRMLKQITEVIDANMGCNNFVQDFLKAFENYLSQQNKATIIEQLNVVWGRKQTPEQQPLYQVHKAKVSGCAIGTFFKVQDKPEGQGWLGKLGFKPLPANPSEKITPYSSWRRGSALESMLEKIASDLYAYLSQGNYCVSKTRLAELPIKNKFTKEHVLATELLEEINHSRSEKIDEGVYVMSKYVENYQDLAELNHCIMGDESFNFKQCLEQKKLPEFVKVEGKNVPLKGLMELLAIARLLGDTDVLGGSGKNAGFLIERDAQGIPTAVRVVKIDPGYAFNFRGVENQFYQSLNPVVSSNNLLAKDKRHLQYGNVPSPILWENLTESQKNQFISTLNSAVTMLENHEEILIKFCNRESFKQTPKQRLLPQPKEYLQDLKENLTWQKEAYKEGLLALQESQLFASKGKFL
jgi:hypothetical protein